MGHIEKRMRHFSFVKDEALHIFGGWTGKLCENVVYKLSQDPWKWDCLQKILDLELSEGYSFTHCQNALLLALGVNLPDAFKPPFFVLLDLDTFEYRTVPIRLPSRSGHTITYIGQNRTPFLVVLISKVLITTTYKSWNYPNPKSQPSNGWTNENFVPFTTKTTLDLRNNLSSLKLTLT